MTSNPARIIFVVCVLLVGAATILAGCSLLWRSQATPIPDLTQVYATLTGIITTQPTTSANQSGGTASPTPPTPTPVQPSATKRSTFTTSNTSLTPQAPCDQAAAGVPIDVSIPDDTVMEPGEAFTKIWRLENAGSCTWTLYYSATFFYGDRMDAPSIVPFSSTVPPGSEIEIAVEMVAPLTPGTYQGNWKLSNADGILFGIGPNGDAPFWVRIIVSETLPGTPTLTPTQTLILPPTPTRTPTPTATPPVQANDTITLSPQDLIDLDSLQVQSQGADLGYQAGVNNYHFLMPMSPTLLGVYGSIEPGLAACQTASMSSAPIAIESLSIGTYLCYRTDLGASGRARLVAVDTSSFVITLDLLTWELP